jgi:FkbM family methyltransferase
MLDTRHNPRFIITRKLNWLLTRFPFFDSVGWQFSIAKLLLPKSNGAAIIKTINGFDMIVDPKHRPGFIDNDLYYLGGYEAGVLKVMRTICAADSVVIDIGANIGAISLYAAKIVKNGKVLAFEPLPGIADDLRDNIKLNKLRNVEVHQVALGPKTGTVSMRPDLSERGSSTLLTKQRPNHTYGKPIQVSVRRLDDYTANLTHVDLMKLDVEGYELGVLLGAVQTIKRFQPPMILEYDPKSPLKGKLDALLSKLEYDIYSLTMGKHYRSHLLPLASLKTLPKDKLTTLILLPAAA